MAELEGSGKLSRLRSTYQAVFDKKPHHSWDEEKLQGLIEERQANPPPPTAPIPEPVAPAADKTTKTVSLLRDVFLPRDPTQPGWETSADTLCYVAKDHMGERIRYEVEPGLADFLVKRDQAIVVG